MRREKSQFGQRPGQTFFFVIGRNNERKIMVGLLLSIAIGCPSGCRSEFFALLDRVIGFLPLSHTRRFMGQIALRNLFLRLGRRCLGTGKAVHTRFLARK